MGIVVMKLVLLSAIAMLAVCPAFAQHAPSPQAIKFEDIKWEPLESGGEISILYTNPTTKATYLIIRAEKNAHVPRHWHTANETITILKGTFVLKHDDSDERSEMTPGSFGYMPARMVHEAWTKDDGATYFITTDGAFDINWVK
jgi:anti-sigma factor ChrR (cupin superfamily)